MWIPQNTMTWDTGNLIQDRKHRTFLQELWCGIGWIGMSQTPWNSHFQDCDLVPNQYSSIFRNKLMRLYYLKLLFLVHLCQVPPTSFSSYPIPKDKHYTGENMCNKNVLDQVSCTSNNELNMPPEIKLFLNLAWVDMHINTKWHKIKYYLACFYIRIHIKNSSCFANLEI